MGKLVIKSQGRVVDEVTLKLGETRIGRRASCDIVLNDPLVSGEHALVKTVGMKSQIHDLDSKNGTYLENRRLKRHELKHGDEIIIGGHTLTYRDDVNMQAGQFGKSPAKLEVVEDEASVTTELVTFCQLTIVEGQDVGKHIVLVKNELVIDNPGKSPARITRIVDGYLIEAAAGPGEPRLNDKPIPPGGTLLARGDVIEVAGTKYQFSK
jgi:hypothetical protein